MSRVAQIIIAVAILIMALTWSVKQVINNNLASTKTAIQCVHDEELSDTQRRHCINNALDNYMFINLDN